MKVYSYEYANNDIISGEFEFKTSESRKRHTIMLSSRFNSDNKEENGPFPGWFVQIVGNSLSIGIGNGKRWQSVISKGQIINNEWNHVAFSIDIKLKKVYLYLNGHFDFKDNLAMRKPCNVINVNALNQKGDFKFDGEISNIIIGSEIIEKEDIPDVKVDANSIINSYIIESDKHIKVIKNNIKHIENDIKSLKDIREQVLSWKYRGLQIDTTLLDNQINTFIEKKNNLEINIKKVNDTLFNLDYKINPNDDNIIDKNNDYLDFYGNCIHNLISDIDILDETVKNLSKFTKLGVELGNAFDKIGEQKDYIVNKILESKEYLKNIEKNTFDMMNIVTINDDI